MHLNCTKKVLDKLKPYHQPENQLIFHISLRGSKPEIWRRVTVPDNIRMDRFNQVIQLAMGWKNAHLHDFRWQQRSIGLITPYDEWDNDTEDELTIYLSELGLQENDTLFYTYDYGDTWEHFIKLEKIRTRHRHQACFTRRCRSQPARRHRWYSRSLQLPRCLRQSRA